MFTLWSASRAANLSREPRPPVSVFPLHRRLPSFWPSPLNFKRLSPLWEKSFSQDTGCPLGVIKEGCERRIASSLCGGKVFCFFHMFCEINILISLLVILFHTHRWSLFICFFSAASPLQHLCLYGIYLASDLRRKTANTNNTPRCKCCEQLAHKVIHHGCGLCVILYRLFRSFKSVFSAQLWVLLFAHVSSNVHFICS